jgi:hypothetical protein
MRPRKSILLNLVIIPDCRIEVLTEAADLTRTTVRSASQVAQTMLELCRIYAPTMTAKCEDPPTVPHYSMATAVSILPLDSTVPQ